MDTILFYLLVSYLLMVVVFYSGWLKIEDYDSSHNLLVTDNISVVIAVKNESKTIVNLLQCLENQSLKKTQYEVIIIDDFSTDHTGDIVKQYALQSKMCILYFPNHKPGKKSAISKGIEKSSNELIVTTDADCVMGEYWLSTIAVFFKEKGAKMAFGPVTMQGKKENIFEQMQQIEFASLVGSGAASWRLGFPNMCNGANLAYYKEIFYEVNGFEGNETINSGDDEFLMHKFYSKYAKEVFFLKTNEVLVTTSPVESIKKLYQQRLRWASKWELYTDWKVKAVAFYVFLVNLSQLISFFILPLPQFGFLLVSRIILEYLFLHSVLGFMRKKLNLNAFLLLVLIYPFYVVFFALAGRIKHLKNDNPRI